MLKKFWLPLYLGFLLTLILLAFLFLRQDGFKSKISRKTEPLSASTWVSDNNTSKPEASKPEVSKPEASKSERAKIETEGGKNQPFFNTNKEDPATKELEKNPNFFREGDKNFGDSYLISKKNGDILYGKNIRHKIYPASLTKLLTALVVYEKLELAKKPELLNNFFPISDELFPNIPENWSGAGLQRGEFWLLRDLFAGLMKSSGNDAALQLAFLSVTKGGKEKKPFTKAINEFLKAMNEKAASLGMANSSFVNVHGYHDDKHFSSVFDLNLLLMAYMKIDYLKELAKPSYYRVKPGKKLRNGNFRLSRSYVLQNTAEHFFQVIRRNFKAETFRNLAVKTGYTPESQYNFAIYLDDKTKPLYIIFTGQDSPTERVIAFLRLYRSQNKNAGK